jgi:hypothetical protein
LLKPYFFQEADLDWGIRQSSTQSATREKNPDGIYVHSSLSLTMEIENRSRVNNFLRVNFTPIPFSPFREISAPAC